MNTAAASLIFRRHQFVGVNDKYALRSGPSFSPEKSEIFQAIQGVRPYDVTGVALGSDNRDMLAARLNLYAEGQRFYDGDHWLSPFQQGERKPVFNFSRVVVDKGADWFVADGWKVVSDEGNEQLAEYLNEVWDMNNKARLSHRGAQFGGIKGEHYLYVTVRTKDRYGRKLARKDWTVRLQALSPEHVFPIWSQSEDRRMSSCLIQFPVPGPQGSSQLYTIWITPDKIATYLDNVLQESMDNPVGEVNVVHVPNFDKSNSPFGVSDIEEVNPINVEYNSVAYAIRQTIRYHAEPTTIIYGARASALEKGASSVWSGLPKPGEAKVENLELRSDLGACFEYLKILKQNICEISSTPQVAFDSFDVRVSSSSAAALQLMFQPLIEKTTRRRIPHREAVREVNRLIILFQMRVIGDDLTELVDDEDSMFENGVEYTSPLPRDEAVELDLGIKKYNAGVWSMAELIRRASNVHNQERLIVELIADRRRAIAETFEKQRALMGERPNSLVAFLGSEVLTEDLTSLQEELATLEDLQKAAKLPKEMTPVGPTLPTPDR